MLIGEADENMVYWNRKKRLRSCQCGKPSCDIPWKCSVSSFCQLGQQQGSAILACSGSSLLEFYFVGECSAFVTILLQWSSLVWKSLGLYESCWNSECILVHLFAYGIYWARTLAFQPRSPIFILGLLRSFIVWHTNVSCGCWNSERSPYQVSYICRKPLEYEPEIIAVLAIVWDQRKRHSWRRFFRCRSNWC